MGFKRIGFEKPPVKLKFAILLWMVVFTVIAFSGCTQDNIFYPGLTPGANTLQMEDYLIKIEDFSLYPNQIIDVGGVYKDITIEFHVKSYTDSDIKNLNLTVFDLYGFELKKMECSEVYSYISQVPSINPTIFTSVTSGRCEFSTIPPFGVFDVKIVLKPSSGSPAFEFSIGLDFSSNSSSSFSGYIVDYDYALHNSQSITGLHFEEKHSVSPLEVSFAPQLTIKNFKDVEGNEIEKTYWFSKEDISYSLNISKKDLSYKEMFQGVSATEVLFYINITKVQFKLENLELNACRDTLSGNTYSGVDLTNGLTFRNLQVDNSRGVIWFCYFNQNNQKAPISMYQGVFDYYFDVHYAYELSIS